MPCNRRLITWMLALLAIAVFWIADALLDCLFSPGVTFMQSLIFAIPAHEIAIRVIVWLAIISLVAWQQAIPSQAPQPTRLNPQLLLSELYQNAPLALFRSSVDGTRFHIVNDQAARLLGYPDVTTMLRECVPKELYTDIRMREQLIDKLRESGRCDGLHIRMNRRDGQTIWVRITAAIHADLEVIDGGLTEITEEKATLSRLHSSEQLHRAIVAGSPLGISVRDRTGRLLMCNEAWVKIWAMPPEAVRDDMQRQREELVFDEREDYLGQRSSSVMRVYKHGGTAYLPECQTHLRRSGMAAWVSQHFYAILNDLGEVDRVVILTEDITARKQVEIERNELYEELQQKVEQVQTLSGLLPICSGCHKIRDDSGYWHQVDMYLQEHSTLEFTHSLCPDCIKRLYPDLLIAEEKHEPPRST